MTPADDYLSCVGVMTLAKELTPELDLLETLAGSDDIYMYFERFVFNRDRKHALRSISLIRDDGLILIWFAGRLVEDWQLAAWRYSPDSEGTVAALKSVRAVSVFLNVSTSAVSYGQLRPPIPDFSEIFVLPSSSGAASAHWTIEPWRELASWHAENRGVFA